jgi:hypothetical protein
MSELNHILCLCCEASESYKQNNKPLCIETLTELVQIIHRKSWIEAHIRVMAYNKFDDAYQTIITNAVKKIK